MDERETLRRKVDETLVSLEPSFSDLAGHDCACHPKITHARWLQCQHEIREMLAEERDPLDVVIARRDRNLHEMEAYYRRPYQERHPVSHPFEASERNDWVIAVAWAILGVLVGYLLATLTR